MVDYATAIKRAFDLHIWKNKRRLPTNITHKREEQAESTDGGFTPGAMTVIFERTVKGVPYNNDLDALFKTAFGQANLGQGTVIFPPEVDVQAKDTLSWNGQSYHVESVRAYPVGGEIVLKVVQTREPITA